uniref:Tetraspanin-5-like n=1 Tax=Sinocyclocheilus rhinocerous TaxID=307959 RepID=A0A673G465_9TELE
MSGKHFNVHEVGCCIKYFIFGFNIIFWVSYAFLTLWASCECTGVLSNISSITDLGGFDPVWLFLVVGGVMFVLGFAGCIGALRENAFLLKFFSVFLGIIFFLELTAGVLAFVFKDWIKDQLKFFINNNIRAYRDDIDLQNLIDFTQDYVTKKHCFIVIFNCNNISQYYCFYCFFDQINAASVSVLLILPKLLKGSVGIFGICLAQNLLSDIEAVRESW